MVFPAHLQSIMQASRNRLQRGLSLIWAEGFERFRGLGLRVQCLEWLRAKEIHGKVVSNHMTQQ